jgi:hypothetical protein
MQVALNINQNELNNEFLSLMKQLFQKENVSEIVVKKEKIQFEEFDTSVALDTILEDISKAGYSAEFIEDLSSGLKKTIY